ncbi:hypothetical protein B0H10DRAFT_1947160 [Mycena sp. CBHHK59/15]|nr:hypothetical protein B0H10DRAFT_1947160 [Mycena sp. CBHHK59/15]
MPSPPGRLRLWLQECEAKARRSQAKAGASKPSQAKHITTSGRGGSGTPRSMANLALGDRRSRSLMSWGKGSDTPPHARHLRRQPLSLPSTQCRPPAPARLRAIQLPARAYHLPRHRLLRERGGVADDTGLAGDDGLPE